MLTIERPSDAQLDYLRDLCADRGLTGVVVGSKQDASECIDAIRARRDLAPWLWDEAGFWRESVPF